MRKTRYHLQRFYSKVTENIGLENRTEICDHWYIQAEKEIFSFNILLQILSDFTPLRSYEVTTVVSCLLKFF